MGICADSEIFRALAGAASLLQPLCDLIALRYGAAASILLVCPMGVSGGKVEMRRSVVFFAAWYLRIKNITSVNSGVTKAALPQTWQEFDLEGYRAMGDSMVRFGQQVFSM